MIKLYVLIGLLTISVNINAQDEGLRININNSYYNIQFRQVDAFSNGEVEYQLDSEAYALTTNCSTNIRGKGENIDFGYYVNGKEVSMETFLEIDPKESNYLFSCGIVANSKTKMGVFLTQADKSNPLESATTSEAIKDPHLMYKPVRIPKSSWKVIDDNDRYFIDDEQISVNQMRQEIKNGREFITKIWSKNQYDGDEWIEHYYYTTQETFDNGQFAGSEPVEIYFEVVGKKKQTPTYDTIYTNPIIEPIHAKEKRLSNLIKKDTIAVETETEAEVQVIKTIDGVQLIDTYTKDGEKTREVYQSPKYDEYGISKTKTSQVKDISEYSKKELKELRKIYPKKFKHLPKKRKELLWDKMYYAHSIVYIDGEKFNGRTAKEYLLVNDLKIYRKFAQPAMYSKNKKDTFYIFTNKEELALSGIKQ